MRTSNLKQALFGVASTAALSMALGISPAAATPPPFSINPNVLISAGGPYPIVNNLGNWQGTSDALIQQTGATTQVETGWVQGLTFQNTTGSPIGSGTTLMNPEGNFGSPSPSVYNLFLTFSATVHGVSGFAPGPLGTIGPGGFTGTLFADLSSNDTFTPGSSSSTGGTAPSVTPVGTGTAGDVVLAEVISVNGDAGTDAATGAPRLDVTTSFVLCNGTANSGVLGGQLVDSTHLVNGANLAFGCGTFDARTYFTSPVPFYSLAFASSQSASALDLGTVNPGTSHPGGPQPNVTLNGIVTSVNFIRVPEPATLSLFGFGLLGLGWFGGKRQKKA